MKVINVTPEMAVLGLGRLGENEHTKIIFDVSDWLEEYPGATIGLANQLPHSSESYACTITSEGDGKYSWTITSAELTTMGDGECQLQAVLSDVVVKGKIYKTKIGKALDGTADPPSVWQSYITDVLHKKEDAEAYAVGTRSGEDVGETDPTYHNNSKYYSEQADGSAKDAEAYAVGKRGGTDVESSDPAYHNNSKYYAENCEDIIESSTAEAIAAVTAVMDGYAKDSEAYAKGTRGGSAVESSDPAYHNNSKYYSEQAAAYKTGAETAQAAAELAQAQAEASAAAEVTDWLEENIAGGSTIAVDGSLTVRGAGADAFITGSRERISECLINEGKYQIKATDLESGQWSYSTKATNAARGRMKFLIPVKKGMVVTYKTTTFDVYFGVLAATSSNTYLQYSGWVNDASSHIEINYDGYMTFIIRNHANTSATVDVSTFDSVVIIYAAGQADIRASLAETQKMLEGNANPVNPVFNSVGWNTTNWTTYGNNARATTELMTLPNGLWEIKTDEGYLFRIIPKRNNNYEMANPFSYGLISASDDYQFSFTVTHRVNNNDVSITPHEAKEHFHIHAYTPEVLDENKGIEQCGEWVESGYSVNVYGSYATTQVLGTKPIKMPKSGIYVSQENDPETAVGSQPAHAIRFFKYDADGRFIPAMDYPYANADFTTSPYGIVPTRAGLYFPYADNLYFCVSCSTSDHSRIKIWYGGIHSNGGRMTNLSPMTVNKLSSEPAQTSWAYQDYQIFGTDYYPTFKLFANGTYVTEQQIYGTIIRLQDARKIMCSPKYSMSAWFFTEDWTYLSNKTIRGLALEYRALSGVNMIDFENVGKTGYAIVAIRSTTKPDTPDAGTTTLKLDDPSFGILHLYDDVMDNVFVEYYNHTVISHATGMHPVLAKNIKAFKDMTFDKVFSFKYGGPYTKGIMQMTEMRNASPCFYMGRMYTNTPFQNVSVKSYATMLKNINSDVYISDWYKPASGRGIGMVCNNLPPVLFGYDWAARVASWWVDGVEYPGFTVEKDWDYKTQHEKLKIGDWLLGQDEEADNHDAHVALVTDIIYINGELVCFEVLESWPPMVRYRYMFVSNPLLSKINPQYGSDDLDTFYSMIAHPDLSTIRPLSEAFGSLNTNYDVGTLMCNRGTDSVYTAHQEHIYITINDDEMTSFGIYKDGTLVDTVTLSEADMVTFGTHPLQAVDIIDIVAENGSGYYTLKPNNKDTAQESFYVAPDQTVTTTTTDTEVTLTLSNPDDFVYVMAVYVPENLPSDYLTWNEWAANTHYSVGDRVKITTTEDGYTVVTGYVCKTENTDASFDSSKWNVWKNPFRPRITYRPSADFSGQITFPRVVTHLDKRYVYNWCHAIYKATFGTNNEQYGTYMVMRDDQDEDMQGHPEKKRRIINSDGQDGLNTTSKPKWIDDNGTEHPAVNPII